MDKKRTIDDISNRILTKVTLMLLEMMPAPSCPLKRQQNEWRKMQVIEDVKRKLDEKYNHNQAN